MEEAVSDRDFSKGRLVRTFVIVLIFIVLLESALSPVPVQAQESLVVEVKVTDQRTGLPLANATALLRGRGELWEHNSTTKTDQSGFLRLYVRASDMYNLYVTADDSGTPGFDYLPVSEGLSWPPGTSCIVNMTIQLQPAASILLDHEPFLVESGQSPQVTCSAVDTVSQQVLWGTSLNSRIGLRSNEVIVPIGVSFLLKIQVSAIIEGKSTSYMFVAAPPSDVIYEQGACLHLDVRAYSGSRNVNVVATKIDQIYSLLHTREGQGFYLAEEQHMLLEAASLKAEGETLLENGDYEASHVKLRQAYVQLSDLMNSLNRMYSEAQFSTSILLLFLAFTAICASYILFEKNTSKNLGTLILYSFLVMLLYILYPGSQLLNAEFFVALSVLSIAFSMAFAFIVSRLLRRTISTAQISLANLIGPVFSIARTSLGRRKLRTSLTILSVMMLVSSFIALTSFSSGYGLVFTRVSGPSEAARGVLVRTPTEVVTSALSPVSGGKGVSWYLGLASSSLTWFLSRDEVFQVAPKCENSPRRQYQPVSQPLARIGGTALWGVMGIVPGLESKMISLDSAVIEGRFLEDNDTHCALISKALQRRLGVLVGQSIPLEISGTIYNLRVVGILDDARVNELSDLDGQSFLPMKIVETGRTVVPGMPDVITEGLAPCDAGEVVITTFSELSGYPEFTLIRLDLVLQEGEDLGDYAVKLALMKGFQAWANTADGVHMANLATYYEGKGLPLLVPWMIVVLTVVVTMLNSLFERREEIHVFSSIGMNPSHISGIFLAEVTMLGLVAGGTGYLFGLAWYKLMAFFAISLQVKMKTSAIWALGAMGVSLAAVLAGCWTALKTSTVITPSLRRRWYSTRQLEPAQGRQEQILPVTLAESEIDEYEAYVHNALISHMHDLNNVTAQIKRTRKMEEGSPTLTIDFVYRPAHTPLGGTYATNRLTIRRDPGGQYVVQFTSEGDSPSTTKAGSLVRETALQWSVRRKPQRLARE